MVAAAGGKGRRTSRSGSTRFLGRTKSICKARHGEQDGSLANSFGIIVQLVECENEVFK